MLLLLLLLVCASTVHHGRGVGGETYYVRPSDITTICPPYPAECNTIDYYIHNYRDLFHSSINTTFQFLAGTHVLEGEQAVLIQRVANFAMIGRQDWNITADALEEMPISAYEIRCQGSVGFNITSSTNVSIQNLLFTNCGAVYHIATIYILQVTNLSISRIVVQNTTGYGVLGRNILGKSNITHSVFKFNRGIQTYQGGNMRIEYEDCPQPIVNSKVAIASSLFIHGYNPINDSNNSTGAGLTVLIGENCSNVTFSINNITASDNEAYDGGNMALVYRSRDITI